MTGAKRRGIGCRGARTGEATSTPQFPASSRAGGIRRTNRV